MTVLDSLLGMTEQQASELLLAVASCFVVVFVFRQIKKLLR